ncbi:hypothetical protein ALP98_200091 [Pseudomonas viridiflava]|uniref:Uncharacterized protein n=2 Tax=Pseudomonas syringae group TaxID=136849 RepID=A0A3M4J1F5_PSEVI|nr:hypothetical protein ALQ30_200397 [Pseudomonas syringae pv. persicae]RMQ10261.1 hypothetical protein ALQ09_200034 [Pseudomonas viridiflava]RMQ72921.1 hypothetical protein ALP98_200091 [Pseudomonas viridiflava]
MVFSLRTPLHLRYSISTPSNTGWKIPAIGGVLQKMSYLKQIKETLLALASARMEGMMLKY